MLQTGVHYTRNIAIAAICAALIPAASAKDKKTKESPKDEIEVVGHVALTDGPVRRFLLTEHYSRSYLYAERGAGQSVTLIDVTRAAQPSVVADLANASGDSGNLTMVSGTAALVSSNAVASTQAPSQTIRIMDFSDPKNPKVAREFAGVTAVTRDEHRGLVFIANGEGVWILQQHLATDPEVMKAYDYYLRYGMSMYPPGK
jgi:hypothetical protein